MEAFRSCPDGGFQKSNNERKPDSSLGLTGTHVWRLQEDTTWANPSFQEAKRRLHLNGEGCGARSEKAHPSFPALKFQLQPMGAKPHNVCMCLGSRWPTWSVGGKEKNPS